MIWILFLSAALIFSCGFLCGKWWAEAVWEQR